MLILVENKKVFITSICWPGFTSIQSSSQNLREGKVKLLLERFRFKFLDSQICSIHKNFSLNRKWGDSE